MENLTGTQLGQYQLRRMIGRGGISPVYEGFQPALGRAVAIKLLPAQLTEQPGYLQRFEQEAQLIAQLEHPAILPIYDYGVQNGMPYIVMRLLLGEALVARLAQLGRPSPGEALQILERIGGALDYAHKYGVIHRDLKPGNILFDNEGNPYLADFGIAQLMSSAAATKITDGALTGTPLYMPPEQAQGLAVDQRGDIYSLGIIAYELLAGVPPFVESNVWALVMQHIQAEPPQHPLLPPEVYAVLAKALAKTPAERFASAGEFVRALRDSASSAYGAAMDVITGFLTAPVKPDMPESTDRFLSSLKGSGSITKAAPAPTFEQPRSSVLPLPAAPMQPAQMPAAKRGTGVILPLGVVVIAAVVLLLLIAANALSVLAIAVIISLALIVIFRDALLALPDALTRRQARPQARSQARSHRAEPPAAPPDAKPAKPAAPTTSDTVTEGIPAPVLELLPDDEDDEATVEVGAVRERRSERTTTLVPVVPVAEPAPQTMPLPAPAAAEVPPLLPLTYHTLKAGDLLRDYRVDERIDKGERSRVYRAYDTQREREVALKIMNAQYESSERAARFKREAQLLGRLHHAHIVPFYDFGSLYDMNYIVMPFLKGGSLARRLEQHKRLLLPDVLDTLDQLAGALDYMHGEGIVHRDLKPTNLVFGDTDNIYLADLGIAKVLDDKDSVALTAVGQTLGTPVYMPPEQWSGERVTSAADQYALACITFQLLTGELPFTAETPFALMLKHVRENPPLLSALRPDLPTSIDAALLRAMEKDPAKRYPNVHSFAAALRAAAYQPAAGGQKSGHVFISYSRADGDYAYRVADFLKSKGLEVWIDSRIEPSDGWWRMIVEAIDTCGAFVIIMSPAAEESKWVEREYMLADHKNKPAFPLLLKGSPFPIYVATQYADVQGELLPPENFCQRLIQAAQRA